MLTDPAIRAVVPPWGGEGAGELLAHLDFDEISAAPPTWLVGFSDTSALLLPFTLRTGIASLYGQNLMDLPFRVPGPLLSWLDVAAGEGGSFAQGASERHFAGGWHDVIADPRMSEFVLAVPGSWRLLDSAGGDLRATGRPIGGCLDSISALAGTADGDVRTFAETHAPEGLIVYVEAAKDPASVVAAHLTRLRHAGWFELAPAVLVGRTTVPADSGLTQEEAVRQSLSGLDVPVVLDVDCGHVPPHLSLVNGCLAELSVTVAGESLDQHFV